MKIFMHRVWRVIRWPLLGLFVLYMGLVAYRIPAVREKDRSDKAVAAIHAQKITVADVTGDHLPPPPNQADNDSTLAGIDSNNNGIRDDVELAIFKLHPDSARIRAAELQYAMALQNELTNVFDSQTLVAAIQEENRAYFCVGDMYKIGQDKLLDAEIKNVEALVLNTDTRKKKYQEIYQKYMTSFADLKNVSNCDIKTQ